MRRSRNVEPRKKLRSRKLKKRTSCDVRLSWRSIMSLIRRRLEKRRLRRMRSLRSKSLRLRTPKSGLGKQIRKAKVRRTMPRKDTIRSSMT